MPNCGSFAVNTRLSFAVCFSHAAVLQANLLASPCLRPDSPHEVIVLRNCPSAAAGLNVGLGRAKHEWVVCVHQDVYLPEGWDRLLAAQLRQAEQRFGPIGVAGVYGVGEAISPQSLEIPLMADRIGWVVDRGRLLRDGPELTERVATLDELLLVIPRDTPLRFDPALGFHLHGADICLQARERGLAVVAIGALCHHIHRRKTNTFLTTENTENTEKMRGCSSKSVSTWRQINYNSTININYKLGVVTLFFRVFREKRSVSPCFQSIDARTPEDFLTPEDFATLGSVDADPAPFLTLPVEVGERVIYHANLIDSAAPAETEQVAHAWRIRQGRVLQLS
jgi:Glycosyltransferase like family